MTRDQLQIQLDKRLDEMPKRHDEFLLGRSRILVMHRKTDALVFRKGVRERFEQPEQVRPSAVRQSSLRQPSAGTIGRIAHLSTMDAACPQPQRREQSIKLFDRAAADQGKRAIEAPCGGGQRVAEAGWNLDSIGAWCQIEEGPVNVEKKTDLSRPQIHRVQRVHSTVAFFPAQTPKRVEWFRSGCARRRRRTPGMGIGRELRPARIPSRAGWRKIARASEMSRIRNRAAAPAHNSDHRRYGCIGGCRCCCRYRRRSG